MTQTSSVESGSDETLDSLVERTEGLQPGRRIFHACGGLIVASILNFTEIPTAVIIALLVGGLLVAILVDIVRLRSKKLNILFYRTFSALASPRERGRIASSTWYVIGVLLVLTIFAREIATAGILVLALADPAASYIGRLMGQDPHREGNGPRNRGVPPGGVLYLPRLHRPPSCRGCRTCDGGP